MSQENNQEDERGAARKKLFAEAEQEFLRNKAAREKAEEEAQRRQQSVRSKDGWDFAALYPKEAEEQLSEEELRKRRNAQTAAAIGTIVNAASSEFDIQLFKGKVASFIKEHAQTLREFGNALIAQKGDRTKSMDEPVNAAWKHSPMTVRDDFERKLEKYNAFLTAAITDLNTIGDAENQSVAGTALIKSWARDNKWDELDRMLRLSNKEDRYTGDDLYVINRKDLSDRLKTAYEAFQPVITSLREIKKQGLGRG